MEIPPRSAFTRVASHVFTPEELELLAQQKKTDEREANNHDNANNNNNNDPNEPGGKIGENWTLCWMEKEERSKLAQQNPTNKREFERDASDDQQTHDEDKKKQKIKGVCIDSGRVG